MKHTLLLLFITSSILAQSTENFESFNLEVGTYMNHPEEGLDFETETSILLNQYTPEWNSWAGWAVSANDDSESPGLSNQYSSASGNGANETNTYVITYVLGTSQLLFQEDYQGKIIESLWLNNNAYARWSMALGDSYAKKFGGESGNDEDFFAVTIRGIRNNEITEDSVQFYLSDYRFENNDLDYIVDAWTQVELSALGSVDALLFSLSSSDIGAFGINTPTYFCVDEITFAESTAIPNIVIDQANQLVYYNQNGQPVLHKEYDGKVLVFSLEGRNLGLFENVMRNLSPGTYLLIYNDAEKHIVERVVCK